MKEKNILIPILNQTYIFLHDIFPGERNIWHWQVQELA